MSPNRNVMLVLSYLWILALIPLLVEKEDREVQWHAKNGLILTLTEIVLWVVWGALTHFINVLACAGCLGGPIVGLVFLVIRILCIVKALNGQRFVIPFLSDYADRF